MSGLPDSWKLLNLDAVAEVQMGQSPDSETYNDQKIGLPFFQGKTEFGKLNPMVRKWCAEPKKISESGDILLSIRAPVGPSNIAIEKCAIGRGLASIRAITPINQDYLFHFVRKLEPWLCSQGTGSTFAAISGDFVKSIEVPIAPLSEQKRIADKLNTVLARVDASHERLDRVALILKRFRQSVLASGVSGKLTENWRRSITSKSDAHVEIALYPGVLKSPLIFHERDQQILSEGWQWKKLVGLAKLESGHTPRKSIPAYWESGDVPWISLQDIRAADGKELFSTKYMTTILGIQNSSARLLPKGTVCFCRDISFGYVTIMGREMATTQHFANWICGAELDPKFLMFSFMVARDFLAMSGQGTTVKTIYMPALKQLQLATPPIAEQHEIVRRVETLFAFADRLEARLATARTAADRLTPALLAKAFRGELVPQDPNDEPASVLLQRLAAAQSEDNGKAKRGRKSTTLPKT